MRTATLPSVRVTPEVRALAESMLKDGETLSMFVEDSVRRQAQMRDEDRAFYARGLASLERVRAGEKTFTVKESMARLHALAAKRKAEKEVNDTKAISRAPRSARAATAA